MEGQHDCVNVLTILVHSWPTSSVTQCSFRSWIAYTCQSSIYRNLVIFSVENISYVIISCSFNFVRSPYRI